MRLFRRLGKVAGRFLRFGGLFNLHIAELLGVKDFATLQAFDKFHVIMPGNDAYLRVFADGCHLFGVGLDSLSYRQSSAGFSTI